MGQKAPREFLCLSAARRDKDVVPFAGWGDVFHRCEWEAQNTGVYDLEPGDEVTWVDSSPALGCNSLFLRVGARLDCYRGK